MQTEQDFVKGQSDNLPKIDSFAMFSYFRNNPDFVSAEIKGVKMMRSGRESYGDNAIGYVQVRRQTTLCTVKARITPEHKVRNKPYSVELTVDESEGEIKSVACKDCTAALGGCKHAVALITWVHRRTEEPSPTSVKCYWKKSKLSEVGTKLKYVKSRDIPFPNAGGNESSGDGSFLQVVLAKSKEIGREGAMITRYFREPKEVEKLSMHLISQEFFKIKPSGTADELLIFCQSKMNDLGCLEAEKLTKDQNKNPLWFELRHARITASKIHEASRCNTLDGSLFESILGGNKLRDTAAMVRGRKLESGVKRAIEKERKTHFKKCGLKLNPQVPVLGASADGINEDFVLEIKCPTTEKAMKTYVCNGKVSSKHMAQIQMQMFMYGKTKGLFCVAHADFEESSKVTTVVVDFDETYVKSIINDAMLFWKKAIFTNLKERFTV